MARDKKSNIAETFLSMLSADERLIYEPIIAHLLELGYRPQKQSVRGYVVSFKHTLHDRQIAKIGIRGKKPAVFFALRFSACAGYSQRFVDVVRDIVLASDQYVVRCDTCRLCKGDRHMYTYELPNGEIASRCGAYAYEIPGVTLEDVDEIKRLIKEQHEYFMAYAVSAA